MNKRKLHHVVARFRVLPTLLLFVDTLFFLGVAVLALRANNQKMIELRDAVFAADEENGDVESALKALREHVYNHMNTSLTAGDNAIRPPIQLKYRYERLLQEAQARLSTSNARLYTEAQNFCEEKFPGGFSGRNRLPCIRDYLDANGVEATEVAIPEDMYKFDFASPSWSPDVAGWSKYGKCNLQQVSAGEPPRNLYE